MLTRTRRSATMLALVVLAALALAVPSGAAAFVPADSDGYVPEYAPWTLPGGCHDNQIGLNHWYTAGDGSYVRWIEYDRCEMERLGATSAGWERLKAHERAHSLGYDHYEGDPETNAAYYPTVDLY